MPSYPFSQVDVFTGTPYLGNPVAVVNCLEAQSVPSDEEMARFANWTNLSETTFLLPPSKGGDYAVRIFTPTRELPFAGHPTLGTCAAFLRATHKQGAEEIVQECGIGLVRIKRDGDKLFFLAPEMSRYEPVDDETVARVCKAMGIETSLVQAAHWIVNGPQWLVLLLPDGETVRNIKLVDEAAANDLEWGIIAPQKDGEDTAHEVRAFALDAGIAEDPITGSLNAGIAKWLDDTGRAPASSYVNAQGTVLGRQGRVYVSTTVSAAQAKKSGAGAKSEVWIGGQTAHCIEGTVHF